MARSILVDAGFLIALLNRRDSHHAWAVGQVPSYPPPWSSCEAALSEAFHLLGTRGRKPMAAFLRRRMVLPAFDLADHINPVLALMQKYANLPMSLADACLVRMTELFPEAMLLTTDSAFHIYRRNGRQLVPCVTPA